MLGFPLGGAILMSLRTRNALLFLAMLVGLLALMLAVDAHRRLDWIDHHCVCEFRP
jgi:hypothetical protein